MTFTLRQYRLPCTLERRVGIEPTSRIWKIRTLPLSYVRTVPIHAHYPKRNAPPIGSSCTPAFNLNQLRTELLSAAGGSVTRSCLRRLACC